MSVAFGGLPLPLMPHLHHPHTPLSPESLRQIQPEPITLEELQVSRARGPGAPVPQFPMLRKIIHYLGKVQKYTGYLFTTFVGIHLLAVVIAPGLGVLMAKSQDLFELGRTVYQQIPGMELVLVTGCTVAHVLSGVAMRMLRNHIRHQTRPASAGATKLSLHLNDTPIITELTRDDIGLGGITGLIGLGYRRLLILRLVPELTPLTFSGYLLIPVAAYHYTKFRWLPMMVDGDLGLVLLQYITHILQYNDVAPQWQRTFNFAALVLVTWLALYHMVSGLWKLRRRFSARDKKLAYVVINTLTALSCVSLWRFKTATVSTSDYMGRLFARYVRYLLW